MGMMGFHCPEDIDVLIREEAEKKDLSMNQLLNMIIKSHYSGNPGLDFEPDGYVKKICEIDAQIKELEKSRPSDDDIWFYGDEKEAEKAKEIDELIGPLKTQRENIKRFISNGGKEKIKEALAVKQKISKNKQRGK